MVKYLQFSKYYVHGFRYKKAAICVYIYLLIYTFAYTYTKIYFAHTHTCVPTWVDLMTRDLYFTILVEVFMNHIVAKNKFHKSDRVSRT